MDIKRLLSALLLSFIFIITWNVFFPPETQQLKDSSIELPEASMVVEEKQPNNKRLHQININQSETKIVTPLVEVDLINGATSINNLQIVESNKGELKHVGAWDVDQQRYNRNSPVQIIRGAQCNPCILVDGNPINFIGHHVEKNEECHIITSVAQENITKQTIVCNDSYTIDHVFQGLQDQNIVLLWDGGLLPSEKNISDDMMYFSIYAQHNDTYKEEFLSSTADGDVFEFDEDVGWGGIKSKYFMKAITNDNYHQLKADRIVFNTYTSGIIDGVPLINSNMEYHYSKIKNGQLKVSSYVGPIDTYHLDSEGSKHLVQLFGFGWFFIGYLGKGIMWLLTSLYKIVPNYGVVCVLFAFIIRLLTGPLTKKSFLSNQKMQAIQPKLKKIQEKYKDDTGKLNQEIMGLYKTEGVNPLGGCLPILVQMPLLIALFQVFRKTIEFRGAPFLPFWITDLSQPDVVLEIGFLKEIWGLSYFFGHGIALLPIIMGVVMFLNMKMTTTNNINPSQTSTMYIMNGFFVLLFNTFPSGLNLYYTVYNILNFIQQKKLQKIVS